MKILVNATTLVVGGGIQIGISFIHFPVVTTQEIEKPRESNPDKPIKYF